MRTRNILFGLSIGFLVLVGLVLNWTPVRESAAQALATPTTEADTPPGGPDDGETPPYPSNAYCLLCHRQPGRTWTLPSGESISLTIDPDILAGSVHGDSNPEGPVACAECHIDHRYPHERPPVQSLREFELTRYAACRTCHEDPYTRSQDSVHGEALRAGRIEAATCIDCHGGHDIQPPDEPRQRISLTCGQCHGVIFEQYRNSVHGAALIDEGNPDVPTCVDCHGVHDIQDPTTALFRVRSPELCASCHADEDLMAKYGISTNVFNSYLSDFHGTTVALFEQEAPNVPTNKAVCYDCHGVHDIAPVDAENSHVIRQNLLETCRQCHPDATADFPDAWVGHFPPTLESQPLLFIVNSFYSILIPVTIGIFILLIATDVIRRIRERIGKNRKRGA